MKKFVLALLLLMPMVSVAELCESSDPSKTEWYDGSSVDPNPPYEPHLEIYTRPGNYAQGTSFQNKYTIVLCVSEEGVNGFPVSAIELEGRVWNALDVYLTNVENQRPAVYSPGLAVTWPPALDNGVNDPISVSDLGANWTIKGTPKDSVFKCGSGVSNCFRVVLRLTDNNGNLRTQKIYYLREATILPGNTVIEKIYLIWSVLDGFKEFAGDSTVAPQAPELDPPVVDVDDDLSGDNVPGIYRGDNITRGNGSGLFNWWSLRQFLESQGWTCNNTECVAPDRNNGF